jgi:hypothetical protein
LGGETSDQRQSSQTMRLSNEYVNRSSKQCAQNSAMDVAFLDRFHINTPTPENVGNTSRQENMFGNFYLFIYLFFVCVCVCVCVFIIFLCFFFLFLLNVVISFKCVCVEDEFNAREDNERENGYHEDSNIGEEGEGGFRGRYQETKYYMPTYTYPSDVGDELPWEGYTEAMTLERCSCVKRMLQNDFRCLDLPRESKQKLKIVLHSLQNFMDAYQKMGPTTDSFIDLIRRRKSKVMGPDKWEVVKSRVSKEVAIYIFNFKEGPKRKMLKVQYFKHPHIGRHLYNIFLAAYVNLLWNDEVPHYFARLFYADFFMGMYPDYINLPSNYYGVGKGRTYDQK